MSVLGKLVRTAVAAGQNDLLYLASLPTASAVLTNHVSALRALQPDPQPAQPPAIPGGAATPPAAPVNTVGGAAAEVGKGMAGRVAGALVPHVASATSGFTGSLVVQTILVDLHAAAASAFWDDLQDYVRTHNVDLGPFNFIKGDF